MTKTRNTRPELSLLELGRRERARRVQVIAARLPGPIAAEVVRRAALAGLTRSIYVAQIVKAYIEKTPAPPKGGWSK